jgi:hypothetical protein
MAILMAFLEHPKSGRFAGFSGKEGGNPGPNWGGENPVPEKWNASQFTLDL